MELHSELVGLFKDMPEEAFEKLKEDIRVNGQIDDATAWLIDNDYENSLIIDGRHRHRACEELGVNLKVIHKEFDSFEAAETFVNSKNHMRRRDVHRRSNVEKRKTVEAELEMNKDRSDRVIADICKVGHMLVAGVRQKMGAQSSNRKAEDGSTFTKVDENPNSSTSPILPESASEEPKSIETEINGHQSEDQLIEKILKIATVNAKVNAKNRGLLNNYLKTDLGTALIERAPITPVPTGFQRLVSKVGIIDLRIGFPNLQQLWVEDYSPNYKEPTRKDKAKEKELLERLDDLDRMNTECATLNEFDAGQMCNRIWRRLDKPTPAPEPKPEAEVVQIGDHAKHHALKWYGVTIKWWEYDGLTFHEADYFMQFVSHMHKELIVAYKKEHGEIRKEDVRDMARDLRLGRPWLKVIVKNPDGIGWLINTMAHAMDNNHQNPQGSMKYYKPNEG